MLYIALVVLLLALIFGPSLWVRQVMRKYRSPADLYPHSGAELARKLVADLELGGVAVEEGEANQDHYDPGAKAVRLSPENYQGRSLTALTVAAHEVGHALQDARGYRPLRLRTRLARLALVTEKLGAGALMAIPVIGVLTRSPAPMSLLLVVGLGSLAVGVLVNLATLPVEWNASFSRALPVLEDGDYIPANHLPHARRLLRAAALTYLAASLASMLNLYRWLAILRR